MAIKKQYLKSKPVCKVTFSIEAKDVKKVFVVGNFNDWNEKKSPLKKLKDGTFKGTIDLKKDNDYEFKYLVDGTYVNDDAADAYVWSAHAGGDNSIVQV